MSSSSFTTFIIGAVLLTQSAGLSYVSASEPSRQTVEQMRTHTGVAKRKPSSTKRASCLLVVEGKTYISGSCEFESIDDQGGFSINGGKYFAYVNADASSARGSWNGVSAESHAHDDLGLMKRNGDCWTSDKAIACAFTKVSSAARAQSYCGTLKDYGDRHQIVDGIFDVFLAHDNTAPADPKNIVKTIIDKKLNNKCVCIGGIAESFDRGGQTAYAFKRLNDLKTCKVVVK